MILCCGEALIDMIPTPEGAFMPHSGGSVFNTSIGIGRQGVDVGLISGVSQDLFGDVLQADLKGSNVSTDHLILSARPTTLAFVKLVNGKASYAFYDENTAGRMIASADMPATLPDATKALFFGGISLAVEPCADAYLDLLTAHAKDHLIMVDPNIRANFIADEPRYRARMAKIIAHADIVKISDEDLDWLVPAEHSHAEQAASLLRAGSRMICLTKGSDGVAVYTQAGCLATATAPAVKVVDTVGAGDAFNAGFLCQLSQRNALSKTALDSLSGEELEAILTFSVAFASDSVTRAGSDPAWHFSP